MGRFEDGPWPPPDEAARLFRTSFMQVASRARIYPKKCERVSFDE